MWVPLVENNEHLMPGADYFVQLYLQQLLDGAPQIDTLLLACTHYPLLLPKIRAYLPPHMEVLVQGNIVAQSLQQYLVRHPAMQQRISQQGMRCFYTTDDAADFEQHASLFTGSNLHATTVHL
jgi:glutamate racemase